MLTLLCVQEVDKGFPVHSGDHQRV